jgi:hypothetical protein
VGGAADRREQEADGGGVGNGTEGHFYRCPLEGKMGDGGCLHAGAACSVPGARLCALQWGRGG